VIDPRPGALLLALATACGAGTQNSGGAPPSVEPQGPATKARCFFDGDVAPAVRATPTLTAAGLELAFEWDAAANPAWVPPTKVTDVSMPFGVECRDPFDVMADTGVTATLTGDRAVRVELPKAMLDSLAQRCASRKLTLRLTMNAQYATPCEPLTGDGLPFHNLVVDVTLAADGKPTFDHITGASYLEG
jgi:hypothetical protein